MVSSPLHFRRLQSWWSVLGAPRRWVLAIHHHFLPVTRPHNALRACWEKSCGCLWIFFDQFCSMLLYFSIFLPLLHPQSFTKLSELAERSLMATSSHISFALFPISSPVHNITLLSTLYQHYTWPRTMCNALKWWETCNRLFCWINVILRLLWC